MLHVQQYGMAVMPVVLRWQLSLQLVSAKWTADTHTTGLLTVLPQHHSCPVFCVALTAAVPAAAD
jgi:hypothetical protein